jgi:hypothetical protein
VVWCGAWCGVVWCGAVRGVVCGVVRGAWYVQAWVSALKDTHLLFDL